MSGSRLKTPIRQPMRIYPAPHYTMGGLWVDYNLESNIPGLFVLGEANFSDHGANRLGASALMQGLADGYFILPYTIANYLCRTSSRSSQRPITMHSASRVTEVDLIHEEAPFDSRQEDRHEFHRELGKIMWNSVGMTRSEASLKKALESAFRNSAPSSGRT